MKKTCKFSKERNNHCDFLSYGWNRAVYCGIATGQKKGDPRKNKDRPNLIVDVKKCPLSATRNYN